jgi:PAS domain S-box-containing protein
MGVPLQAPDGAVMGHLAVLDTRPMLEEPRLVAVLQFFAERASAELRRLHAERRVKDREEQLTSLFGGAMDAILELDGALKVTLANPAAERVLGGSAARLAGRDFLALLAEGDAKRVEALAKELVAAPLDRRSAFVPGVLRVRALDGREFAAEVTLACHRAGGTYHTPILRDGAAPSAEARIESLDPQARYPWRGAARAPEPRTRAQPGARRGAARGRQVAGTDAACSSSARRGPARARRARDPPGEPAPRRAARPPQLRGDPTLIEATFGHEGRSPAIERREALRLADGGTIFLDEIGELTPLQAKLLRVLQEGSSSRSAARARARSTCASSRRPTATSRCCGRTGASARTSSTG